MYHTIKFWLIITLLSVGLGVWAILCGILDKSGNAAHKIARLWSRLLCEWNGVKVEIIGMEQVRKDQPQIFVANHQGFFDIFALSGYLPVQMRWVAKSSLFHIPIVGWAMKAAGYISVKRENRKQAYRAFLKTVEKIKSGCSIVIFPEGTRSEDGTVGPFKKGSHLLAARSGAPMVPVTIIGTGAILKKGSLLFQPGFIRIIISPPVTVNESMAEKGDAILGRIRDTICVNHAANSGSNQVKN